jgi:hypothetical protein
MPLLSPGTGGTAGNDSNAPFRRPQTRRSGMQDLNLQQLVETWNAAGLIQY